MSKTSLALVASLALMLAGPAGAFAGDAKKGTQEKTFKGEIVSVNTPANQFTVRSKKDGKVQEMTFVVEVPVSVTREGEIVPLGDLGVNWIDTAAVYGLGHSEEVVGRLLRETPASARPLVFTKCGLVWDEAQRMSEPRRVLSPDSIRA